MNESIIVGLVIGGGVALITGYISHWFRLREMKIQSAEERERLQALWAQEEQRRQSDRRREVYERELGIVGDAVDAVMEAIAATKHLRWLGLGQMYRIKWRIDWVKVSNRLERAYLVALSLRDDGLMERCEKLIDDSVRWSQLFDWRGGRVVEGKEEEFQEAETETEWAASEVWRRLRQMLEEV